MVPFLVHHNSGQSVDGEMFASHFGSGREKVSMCLIVFSHWVISVPQRSILFAHKCKEDVVFGFEHVNTFGTPNRRDRRSRHTHGKRQQFLLGAVAGVDELLVSFYATQYILDDTIILLFIFFYLQNNRRITRYLKMVTNCGEPSAINFAHSDVGFTQRLGNVRPNGFGTFAVAAPRSVKHNQPLTLMLYIQEAIT